MEKRPKSPQLRQDRPPPQVVPPTKRKRPPATGDALDRLTPIERYIEDQKRRELERPYDDELPF